MHCWHQEETLLQAEGRKQAEKNKDKVTKGTLVKQHKHRVTEQHLSRVLTQLHSWVGQLPNGSETQVGVHAEMCMSMQRARWPGWTLLTHNAQLQAASKKLTEKQSTGATQWYSTREVLGFITRTTAA